MDSGKNFLLMGIIILLIGILSVLINFTGLTVFDLMIFAVGAAFLLLYRTKRKSWSLIAGGYFAYFGFTQILGGIVPGFSPGHFFLSMFFIVPALIFFVLYFDKNKRELLVPASIFFWLGIYVLLRDVKIFFVFVFNQSFMLYMSAAFFTIYAFGKNSMKKWPLYVGASLSALGLLDIFTAVTASLNFGFLRPLASLLIIAVSVVIIIRAVRKK